MQLLNQVVTELLGEGSSDISTLDLASRLFLAYRKAFFFPPIKYGRNVINKGKQQFQESFL